MNDNELINYYEPKIRNLNLNQLYVLNTVIVDRIKYLQRANSAFGMAQFKVGQNVWFWGRGGERVDGIIIKFNQKTVSIVTEGQTQWNVSPNLLHAGD